MKRLSRRPSYPRIFSRRYSNRLDLIKNKKFQVLDKGFVRLVDCMPTYFDDKLGLDKAIVDAARISYSYPEDQQTTKNTDKNLIDFLMRHKHTSPFEMIDFKFHIKVPIFVFRQWIRHRTASVNEISARYAELGGEFYTPHELLSQAINNRQCSGNELTDVKLKQEFFALCKNPQSYKDYKQMLDNNGVSREIARIILPLNTYTEAYWKIDLHNLFHFLRLRMSNDAQKEIVEYADTIYTKIVKPLCPISSRSFEKHVLNSVTFSELDIDIIKEGGFGNIPSFKDAKKIAKEISKGEYRELIEKINNILK